MERLAAECDRHAEQLHPFARRCLMATECGVAWTLVGQGAREREPLAVVQGCEGETAIQLKWLAARMKEAAPQAVVVAD